MINEMRGVDVERSPFLQIVSHCITGSGVFTVGIKRRRENRRVDDK